MQPNAATAVNDAQAEPSSMPGEPKPRGRHQGLTIAFHWLTVLLIVIQFSLAVLHELANDDGLRRSLLAAHRSLGVVIALVVITRLGWRLLGMRLPAFPASMSKWHQWGVRVSEWGLYGLLLTQPATGLASVILRGRPFDVFGFRVPSLMTPDKYWAVVGGLHELGAYVLATMVLIHAAAALVHRLVAKDGVLESMLPVRARKES
jgi:cytochrome b561